MKTIKYLLSVLMIFAISACTELTPGVDEIIYESIVNNSSSSGSSTNENYNSSDDTSTDDNDSSTNSDDYSDPTGTDSGYDYVDLGLSVMWATCNIGADSPSDYGAHYAWGEVSTKSSYTSSNCSNYGSSISDYSGNSTYDVATKILGSHWRTPTQAEANELVEECTWTWTTLNGVKGYKVTGSNGNSIFIPAAGWKSYTTTITQGSTGSYWLSTPISTTAAYNLYIDSSKKKVESAIKWHGQTVRAVYDN